MVAHEEEVSQIFRADIVAFTPDADVHAPFTPGDNKPGGVMRHAFPPTNPAA